MPEKKNDQDFFEQPLMSTGTTVAGFGTNPVTEKVVNEPKIGNKTIGVRLPSNHQR